METKYNNDSSSMPRQKLSSRQKGKKWKEQNIDSAIACSLQNNYNGRTSRAKKLSNYNLVNSKFDPADFEYILNPYGLEEGNFKGIPLQIFNVVRSKVERLKGEEMLRPFGFIAVGVDGEVVQLRTEERKKLIRSYLEQELQAALGQPMTDEQGNPVPQPELERILADFDKNHKNIREKWVNDILNYLKYREELEIKFNEGFEHALISAEEVYYVGIAKGEPQLRVVNPPNLWYDKTPDMKKIQTADRAVEYRVMSRGEIMDEYGDLLSNEDLNKIDKAGMGTETDMMNHIGMGYTYPAPASATSLGSILDTGAWGVLENGYAGNITAGQFVVYCVAWRSWKKIGFHTYTDEAGESQTVLIDDTFELSEEMEERGESVEWEWVNQAWKGVRIDLGSSRSERIYCGIEPLENQIDGLLPYVGRLYNSLNSESVSLVDLIAPYQALHAVVWHKLKKEAAKAKGKKQVMDLAQIPRSQGFDMDKWMKYYEEMDIAFINSFEEGTEGQSTGKTSAFNQFTSIDMTISNNFMALMGLIDKIEMSIDKITGISPQSEGQIGSYETATNAGRAIVQSSYITEPWFYIHNECKKDVLNHLVKVAKIAYRDGKVGQFIFNDSIRIMLDIDGDMINDSEFDVFISGSQRDRQLLEDLKNIIPMAMQADKANLSDYISAIKSYSISEVSDLIRNGEQDKIARDQQAMESQQNTMLQNTQMNVEAQRKQREWEGTQRQLDRENKIATTQMAQLGLSDTNSNGIIDIMELDKIRQKEREATLNANVELEKINQKEQSDKAKLALEEKKLKLKEKEIAIKRIAANKKSKG